MFGRQRKESENPELFPQSQSPSGELTTAEEIEEMMTTTSVDESDQDDTELTSVPRMSTQPTPEIVTIVEKISGILSPYFIVLVGLFLYKNNVFLGTILIVVGILSLLKISWNDMVNLWEKLQKTLNSKETDFGA